MLGRKFNPRALQTGVALISVLLVVTILMAVASRLLARHNLVINQHQNTFEQNQALQYALGAETLAIVALRDDVLNSGKESDHLLEFWAQDVLPFELDDGGFLEAQLNDMHRCLNLNNLAGANAQIALEDTKRLLKNLGLDIQLADTWTDWIDADGEVIRFGAEDSQYQVGNPPHRTPNTMVTSTSELYLLNNVDRDQLHTLLPHICLLPDTNSNINVNTAGAQVLAALDENLNMSITEPIVAMERTYNSKADFVKANDQFSLVKSELDTHSTYFVLHAQSQVGSASVTLQSWLKRDNSDGSVTVLGRDFGKLFRSKVTVAVEAS